MEYEVGRRRFLESLIAMGLAATLDTERLLWTPTKKIFIPRETPKEPERWVGAMISEQGMVEIIMGADFFADPIDFIVRLPGDMALGEYRRLKAEPRKSPLSGGSIYHVEIVQERPECFITHYRSYVSPAIAESII